MVGVSDASVAGLYQALGVEPSQAGSLIQQHDDLELALSPSPVPDP